MRDRSSVCSIGARRKATLLVLASAGVLAACSSSSHSSSPSTASSGGSTATSAAGASGSGGKLTIAFNMGAEADPFFIAMNQGAEAEAKSLGVNLIWQGDPSQYSPATQIPIVDQLLAEHPSALIISPTDPDALQPAVNQAIAQGIPVVNVDTHVTDLSKVLSFITGDNQQGGAAAADAMAAAMHYTAGQTYQVVVGASSATTTTNTARLAGFKAEIAAKYPGIKVMAEAYSQSQPAVANTNVNNWLTEYPNLKGIFAIDGTNASGAAAALQARNLVGKVALVGYDAYSTNVALLQKNVFAALIAQNPTEEGKLAVQYAVQYLNTKSTSGIPHEQTLPNIVLTPNSSAADLAQYTYPTA
ncbi:MAG: substrate-binding domain-containing protein [Actinomycetota bacterium]|nr:substrate-binding domain-containing protein [Actinomycetota bacterium]